MADFISFNVDCPHCGKSLMNAYQPIMGKPSIRVSIEAPDQKGTLRLCSLYGCHQHESDIELKDGQIYNFKCPSCNTSLNIEEKCDQCEAPLVGLRLEMGGKAEVCSRKGCENHYIAFKDLNDALNALEGEYGHSL